MVGKSVRRKREVLKVIIIEEQKTQVKFLKQEIDEQASSS